MANWKERLKGEGHGPWWAQILRGLPIMLVFLGMALGWSPYVLIGILVLSHVYNINEIAKLKAKTLCLLYNAWRQTPGRETPAAWRASMALPGESVPKKKGHPEGHPWPS
jgi:hypothetical protein